MSTIDGKQRQRERALLLAAILDGAIGLLLLIVGLAAGSLTCFAESLRGNMKWTINLVSLAVPAFTMSPKRSPPGLGAGRA